MTTSRVHIGETLGPFDFHGMKGEPFSVRYDFKSIKMRGISFHACE